MDRGAWWAAVHGVAKSNLTEHMHIHTHSLEQPSPPSFWDFPPLQWWPALVLGRILCDLVPWALSECFQWTGTAQEAKRPVSPGRRQHRGQRGWTGGQDREPVAFQPGSQPSWKAVLPVLAFQEIESVF